MQLVHEEGGGPGRAETLQRAAAASRRLQIMAGAMMTTVLGAAGIVYFLRHAAADGPPMAMDPTLPWLLVSVGFALLIIAPFATRRLFRAGGEEAGGEAGTGQRIARYSTATLVGFALREAGGLLGAVTAFVAADPVPGYALAGAAILMMVRAWPRREILEALLEPER